MKKILVNILLLAASAAAAGILAILLMDGLVMPYIVDVPNIKVPRLRALESARAEARLEQWGLAMATGDSMHHEEIPIGAVIDQDPQEGQRVKRGRRITVTLSKGPRYYIVPDIGGVSLREAQLQLESNQLRMGDILYVSSESIPRSAVIDQSPKAGTPLARGTAVDLRISNGPPSTLKRVPDLNLASIEAVEDSLRKYEMRLGRIENRIDNNHPIGTVLSQDPPPGAQAPRYARINLVVSARQRPNDNGDRP